MVAFDEELQCHFHGVDYEPVTRQAVLRIGPGECVDKVGAIRRIMRNAPWVQRIDVISGDILDTSYQLCDGRWLTWVYLRLSKLTRRR